MQLGSIVVAGICGMVGLVAGRAGRPTPAVVSAAPARVESPRAIAAAPVVAVEVAAASDDEGDRDGVDVGEAIANAQAQAAAHAADHNTVHGTISERDVGDVAGATVVLAGASGGPQLVAITDEHGQYAITQVAAGSYTMTVYYNDRTLERTGVVASEYYATTQDEVLEPPAPVPYLLEGPSDMTNTYTVEIPLRTFEGNVIDEE